MGFYDAFNPSQNWFADSYLAIDQGPIICMIENYRSGLLWDYFMRNEEIQTALDKIGFTEDNSLTQTNDFIEYWQIYPNPNEGQFYISGFKNQLIDIRIYDNTGRAINFSTSSERNLTKISLNKLHSNKVLFITIKSKNSYNSKKIILNP